MKVDPGVFDQLAAAVPGVGRNPASVRARLVALERLLERAVPIPGTSRRVGLDALLGLVPVVGDVATGLMSAYFIWEARNLGLSKLQLLRMGANVGIDTLLGAVPVVGDLFDLAYKSNTKNLRILKKHLDRHHPAAAVVDGQVLRPSGPQTGR